MPFAGGSGTQSDPYQIETWEHLDSVRNNVSSYFVLNNDLNPSTSGYDTYASSNANNGEGWQPIKNPDFAGVFNGNGYVIKGLYIDRNDSFEVGLFGLSLGEIKNVGIVNADITAPEANQVALLVGWNDGGTIHHCFATGTVSAKNGIAIGGLVGRNGGIYTQNELYNCYAHTEVTGDSAVGGLIGQYGETINNSYSTGQVTGNTAVGGLIGQYSTDVQDSYWDIQNSGQSTSVAGTGLNTDEMQGGTASSNMAFDFTNTWEEVLASDSDTAEDGYPILQGFDRITQLKAQNNYQTDTIGAVVATNSSAVRTTVPTAVVETDQ